MNRLPRLSQKEAVILELLAARGEMYGLDFVRRSEGRLKRGTVYVTLGRMEDKGLVRSRREEAPADPGPPRRLYQLSGLGVRVYAAFQAAEDAFGHSVALGPAMAALGLMVIGPVFAHATPDCEVSYAGLIVMLIGLAFFFSVYGFSFWAMKSLLARLRETRVQCAPGSTLWGVARVVFTKRTYSLVFEPILVDYHREYFDALSRRAFREASWRRVQYTCAFSCRGC